MGTGKDTWWPVKWPGHHVPLHPSLALDSPVKMFWTFVLFFYLTTFSMIVPLFLFFSYEHGKENCYGVDLPFFYPSCDLSVVSLLSWSSKISSFIYAIYVYPLKTRINVDSCVSFQHWQWVDLSEVTWSYKNELHYSSRLIIGTELHHYQVTLQVLIPTPALWQIRDSKECSYGNCCAGTSWLPWLWQCHIQGLAIPLISHKQ